MGLTNAQRLQIQRTQVNNSTNSSQLNGIPASGYPLLNGDNVFTGDNTFNGNQIFSGSISITGSIFSAVTGSLFGTSSWAQYAISSSYALSASRAVSSSYALNSLSGSYALTASYAMNGGGGGPAFPFSGSAVITGSLIVSSSGISILDTSQGMLFDSSNQLSVWWPNRTLRISSTEISLDWLNRQLYTSTSLDISLDWQDRYLRSEGGAISVDWRNRYLVDSTNVNRIDWENGYILDNGTLTSIDWQNRYLVGTTGVNKIDWEAATTKDSNNITSIDWENRIIYNTLGGDVIQWNNYLLYDPAQGQESLDWLNRKTRALDGYFSIDWENRTLTDSLGNTALNWYSASGSPGIRLYGTASYALTASYVDTLNQNVLITGSLTVGASSIGANENTLIVGPSPAGGTGEGGQILLQAVGGTYTTASMIDNYQNKFRILRGTNASSDAYKMQIDMHTGQMQLPNYNSATAFSGTVVAALNVDNNGYIIPTATVLDHQLAAQQAAGSVLKGYNIGCPIITLATSGQSLNSGVCVYTAIYIHTTTTITGVKWVQQTQGVYTANNYNGVGLYSTSGGTLTLVASSTNDGNIWKAATSAFSSKAFSSTYSAATGLYYIGALYSTSAQTTAPAIGFGGSAIAGTINLGVLDYTNNNKTNGTAGSGLTALAASQAASGITAVQHRYAFYLY